ncbi:tetratricopeptide repeat protein [Gluconobacter morbifer]|uniref:Putative flagellin modification protein FlbA n=1 Tax=Gluconobacter morbifer G707 TaxID=1088869 RepID=G6XGV6_9PROT|nr:tetratricopeptide repeat protein [Gluconobacter morbifer]EHH69414.1 putative flagellin modification protein FlbA [Gluconobacter morbifer G707]
MSAVLDPAETAADENPLKDAVAALHANQPERVLDLVVVEDLPSTPEVRIPAALLRARALFRLSRHVEAAAELEQASTPYGPHPITGLIDEAPGLGLRHELLPLLRECRKLAPQDTRLLEAAATLLLHQGHFNEAEALIRESLRRRPGIKSALNLLVMILTEKGEFDEALTLMDTLRQSAPKDWAAICNKACILSSIGRLEEAANLYRQAIPLAPQEPQLRLNHSITMLKSGRMAQGWAEHEWRFGLPGHTNLPLDRLLPNISPDIDLRGKRVLVTQEEGLGDTLMYLRYIPALGRTGAIIHIWGAETLAAICRRVEGVSHVQVGGTTPEFDYHCPFISLPRAFAGTPDAMGAPVPYLSADPVKADLWKDRLKADHQLRVGLVWAGGARPENTAAMMVDRQRSIPLLRLAPLSAVNGMTFYSLQKDAAASQIADFPAHLVDYMPECRDMDDTAALVANLDIVVSVDTSMVHLAGGMGKPVIMMDRFNNCWRWLHDREDSPWYPQLRIVRQTCFRDWTDVVSRVADLLEKAVDERQ